MGRKIALCMLVTAVALATLVGALVYLYPDMSVGRVLYPVMAGFLAPIFFVILPVAVPVAIAVAIAVWVLRAMGVIGARGVNDEKSAREILDQRFASGEIDRDEYEERKLAISS